MNIDNPVSVFDNHGLRNFHEETGQDNQIRLAGIHRRSQRLIKGIPAAVRFGRNDKCRNLVRFRPLNGIGTRIIADDRRNLSVRDTAAVNRI